VLGGPHYLGGAAFFHFYDDQGYGQVKLFIKFWRSPECIPGKLLRITVAWATVSLRLARYSISYSCSSYRCQETARHFQSLVLLHIVGLKRCLHRNDWVLTTTTTCTTSSSSLSFQWCCYNSLLSTLEDMLGCTKTGMLNVD
jgi:hypothetical protein